ncbi:oxidoreductase [Mesorhizobium sp. B4-1-1]|nr:oxidoreductase [Mesorhizobium sp. B4-1-1]
MRALQDGVRRHCPPRLRLPPLQGDAGRSGPLLAAYRRLSGRRSPSLGSQHVRPAAGGSLMDIADKGFLRLKLARVEAVSQNVKSFFLEHPHGLDLPTFSPGSHLVLMVDIGGRVRRNAYSLTSDPDDRHHYAISVLHQPEGRGGSRFLHESLRAGDELTVRRPLNFFPVDRLARRHLLIAGGIGITPFLSMARELGRMGAAFELHYSVRSAEDAPFVAMLHARCGPNVHVHDSGAGTRLDISALLRDQQTGTHVYVCGSPRMMGAAVEAAGAVGWPSSCFHSERFKATAGGVPFSVLLPGKEGRVIEVSSDQSMLEALEDAGVEIDSMCRVGACGKCRLKVQGCTGRIVHNDHVLDATERAEGSAMMPCVSRVMGGQVAVKADTCDGNAG